ncbi:MAG TPA: pirin family protein [Usitatibacter sp.]|nr:pirin family protein [Usitatibacter sp.]
MSALANAVSRRAVERVLSSEIAPVGTFTVRRALPARDRHAVGPWVFLDHFGPFRTTPGKDGVGAHPHAGIETVTYLLAGRNEHRDSAGHTGIVTAGGAQWMTAGRGIVHAERPLAENDAERTMHGVQLWTSLPRLLKTMEPRYQRIGAEAIPAARAAGCEVRVIAGAFGAARGPAEVLMPTFLWHATIAPGAALEAELPEGEEAGAYVIGGDALLEGGIRAKAGELAVWEGTAGGIRLANAGRAPLEAMVLGGAPAEGPLVFHGPFVMTSVDQVRAAEIAYRTGRMGVLGED